MGSSDIDKAALKAAKKAKKEKREAKRADEEASAAATAAESSDSTMAAKEVKDFGGYMDAPPGVKPEMARSVAHRALPDCDPKILNGPKSLTLCLFYQYVEPLWTDKEHKAAMKFVNELAAQHKICGRGRCAQEGLNCTLTGPPLALRAFCMGLRQWNPLVIPGRSGAPAGLQYGEIAVCRHLELTAVPPVAELQINGSATFSGTLSGIAVLN